MKLGSPLLSLDQKKHEASEQHIGERQGQHHLPANLHQLVVSKPRNRPPHDNEKQKNDDELYAECKHL